MMGFLHDTKFKQKNVGFLLNILKIEFLGQKWKNLEDRRDGPEGLREIGDLGFLEGVLREGGLGLSLRESEMSRIPNFPILSRFSRILSSLESSYSDILC